MGVALAPECWLTLKRNSGSQAPERWLNLIQNTHIEPLIRSFVENAPLSLKRNVVYNDENLFLFREFENVYLIVLTKNNEIIKMIDDNQLSCRDIYQQLKKHQEIGFASYVYIPRNKPYFGFINTILAPKINAFTYLINRLLKLGIHSESYKFKISPLLQHLSRNELRDMEFIGLSHIEISKDCSLSSDLSNFLFGKDNVDNFDSFKVTIKPQRGKNLRSDYDNFLDNLPEEGLEKFRVKAKREIGDALTEYYITGSKNICDTIEKSSGRALLEKIQYSIERNNELAEKLNEFIGNDDYEKTPIEDIVNISRPEFWTNFTVDI